MNKTDPREKHIIPDWLKECYLVILTPSIQFLTSRKIHPNFITTLSCFLSGVSGLTMASGNLRWAGGLILVSGTLDILDGAVARLAKRVTSFGAFYDSTLDRYAELAIYFGILFYFLNQKGGFHHLLIVWVCLAMGGSFMVSYIRARAEGLGLECKVGFMQRPERIVLLGFGALFHENILIGSIILIAVFSNLTAIQRIIHVWKLTRRS